MAWPADVVVLGFAGRLAQIKGADILLNAVAQLLARGLSFRLVVVGDGAEMENLQVMARDLGIDAITHFAGRVPRALIYSAIKGFGIAAVPSREEGFGLSAIEAMAAGVPVVASRVDALQEVVLDGTTGLLCPAEDAGALAAGLARLVSDPGSRHAMGVAGAAHVARRYDTPAYRASMAELLAGWGCQSGMWIEYGKQWPGRFCLPAHAAVSPGPLCGGGRSIAPARASMCGHGGRQF
jgi:glycosyltransferase involved in cell wall biosynthesis